MKYALALAAAAALVTAQGRYSNSHPMCSIIVHNGSEGSTSLRLYRITLWC